MHLGLNIAYFYLKHLIHPVQSLRKRILNLPIVDLLATIMLQGFRAFVFLWFSHFQNWMSFLLILLGFLIMSMYSSWKKDTIEQNSLVDECFSKAAFGTWAGNWHWILNQRHYGLLTYSNLSHGFWFNFKKCLGHLLLRQKCCFDFSRWNCLRDRI